MNNQIPSIQLFSHISLLPRSIRRFRADARDARVFQWNTAKKGGQGHSNFNRYSVF